MPEARGLAVIISCFVDANHAGDVKDRRSQTGIFIFLNRAPIHWYSKKQTTVESSTFGAECVALKITTEIIEELRYKLRMFDLVFRLTDPQIPIVITKHFIRASITPP